jgi:hypothetical protein
LEGNGKGEEVAKEYPGKKEESGEEDKGENVLFLFIVEAGGNETPDFVEYYRSGERDAGKISTIFLSKKQQIPKPAPIATRQMMILFLSSSR